MDPVSIQSANLSALRPAIALQGDVGAVLQEGRVLAGEVLQSFDGGSLLIGVGRHRVPAESHVELPVGHRFLFQVEADGDGIALRVLGNADLHEPALLAALRSAVAHEAPLGQQLGDLAALLRARAGGEELLSRLESLLAPLRGDGAELAARLASTGLRHEGRLAVAAALELPAGEAVALSRELEAWLGGRLVDGLARTGSRVSAVGLLADLRQELASTFGVVPGSPEAEALFADFLRGAAGSERLSLEDLPRLLHELLGRLLRGPARGRAHANLASANLPGLGRGLDALLLRRLLDVPARAPDATRAAELARAQGGARNDLKALLLQAARTFRSEADGNLAETLTRVLSGLEADQLLNVARSQTSEPLLLWLPFPDGERWTTLQFQARRRRAGGEGQGGDREEQVWRFELSLELSRTGPLRADLVARQGALFIGLRVARPEVAEHFEREAPALRAGLEPRFGRVDVVVSVAPEADLRRAASALDVRYLRERRLMDLSA